MFGCSPQNDLSGGYNIGIAEISNDFSINFGDK